MAKQPPVTAKSFLVLILDIIISIFVISLVVNLITRHVLMGHSKSSGTGSTVFIIGTVVFLYTYVAVQWYGGTILMHLIRVNPREKKKAVQKKSA